MFKRVVEFSKGLFDIAMVLAVCAVGIYMLVQFFTPFADAAQYFMMPVH